MNTRKLYDLLFIIFLLAEVIFFSWAFYVEKSDPTTLDLIGNILLSVTSVMVAGTCVADYVVSRKNKDEE